MIYLEEIQIDLLSTFLILCIYSINKRNNSRHRKRKFKVRPINRRRNTMGGFQYFKRMKTCDEQQFFKFTRMTRPVFQKLLDKLKPHISKSARSDGISAEQRLIITLQYLSQGTSMQVLAWNFHCGHTTVHKIIHETCQAIWKVLKNDYLKSPSNREDWLGIADRFNTRWNFPNCLGALDGKHIHIQAPAKSGSLYYNYKNTFSVVLLATCDSAYRFTLVDIGAYGSQSDGGVFKNSVFGGKLEQNDFHVPHDNILKVDGKNTKLPYFLVADEAFPLKAYIMRPYGGKGLTYSQRIFNYRLSRARQTIENTFGILVARWRILKTTINAKVENVDNIVKALTVLHNYCMAELGSNDALDNVYCPPGFVDTEGNNGSWREEVTPLKSVGRMSANRARKAVYMLRDTLAKYFLCEGKVSWQHNIVTVE